MDCPNCGKQNSDDSPLCSSCGWVLCWQTSVQNEKGDGMGAMRVVSVSALVLGVATFFVGLLLFLSSLWFRYPEAGHDFDFIGLFLVILYFLSWCLFLPLAPIALVVAIVTLFIERNICLRLLPLVFVLGGIGLFAASYTF